MSAALVALLLAAGDAAHSQQPPTDATPPPAAAGRVAPPSPQPGALWPSSTDVWGSLLAGVRITDIVIGAFAGLILITTALLAGRMGNLRRSTERLVLLVEEQRGDTQTALEAAKQSAQAATEAVQALAAQTANVATSLAMAESAATAADEAAKAAAESVRVITAQAGQVSASLTIAETATSAAAAAAKAALQSATGVDKQLGELTSSISRARDAAEAAHLLAASAKQSADTAIASDRPHLFVSALKLLGLRQPAGADGLIQVSLTYEFANYGRSPALIRGVSVVVSLGPPPETPVYGTPTPVRHAVPAQGVLRTLRPLDALKLRPLDIEKVLKAETPLVAFGYVEYADTQGRTHRSAFMFGFSFGEGDESAGFHPVGSEACWQYS